MIRLSAFADEISPDLEEQIAVLHGEGIRWVELRAAWDTNVLDLSDAQLARIRQQFGEEGIGVSVIGSPLGKVPVDVPLEEELRRQDRAMEIAELFGTRLIRIFSFYPPAAFTEQESTGYREAVLSKLREMAARAEARGVTLLHENDTDLYGDTIEHCLDVMNNVPSPSLKAAFDPANFIVSGEVPYPDAYDALHGWVTHVHVKDALPDRTVVAAGEGVARWPELLERLRADGYEGIFSLEPHLVAGGKYGGFSGPERFQYASQAFQGLLRDMGWERE
jgi:sugar phosphate isomerase/epimerase